MSRSILACAIFLTKYLILTYCLLSVEGVRSEITRRRGGGSRGGGSSSSGWRSPQIEPLQSKNLGFGESCEQLRDCSLTLECINGACGCPEPGTWDPETNKCYNEEVCYTRAYLFYDASRGRCTFQIGYAINLARYDLTNFTVECPDHSVSILGEHARGCICESNYTPRTNGRSCLLIRHRGETCLPADEVTCDPVSKLTCSKEGVCDCAEDQGQYWNEAKQACVIEVGQSCKPWNDWECTPRSGCNLPRYGDGGTCECFIDYVPDSEGKKCFQDFGKSCDTSEECLPGNVCIDGLCGCPNPILQQFDASLKKCRVLVGSSCSSEIPSNCVDNAECVNGRCVCVNHFQSNAQGICIEARAHGSSCGRNQCNSTEGLACVNGVCTCINPDLKIVEGKGCTAPIGSGCGLLRPSQCKPENESCVYYVGCDESLECKQEIQGSPLWNLNENRVGSGICVSKQTKLR